MELRGGDDRPRHRSALDQLFLPTFALIVVGSAGDSVEADDGQQHMMAHAGAQLGVEQIPGRGGEVLARLVGADRWGTDGVDNRIDPLECGVQAVPGQQVDAQRAADSDDVVPVALQCGNSAAADVAGRAGYRDSHDGPPIEDSSTRINVIAVLFPSRPGCSIQLRSKPLSKNSAR